MATPAMRKAFQEARTEFKELSIGELKDYEVLFTKYDTGAVCIAISIKKHFDILQEFTLCTGWVS